MNVQGPSHEPKRIRPKRKKREVHTIGPKDLLRALKTESDSLQKIHSNVRVNLQKLEAEEHALKLMIRRELQRLRGGSGSSAEAPAASQQGGATNVGQPKQAEDMGEEDGTPEDASVSS